ncbi:MULTISPECIES: hypothetical protein [Paenibacillus]|uniref:Replication protein n=1 Tax=Paenibacillus odorifer TaxID=189426 RepID=A0ABX3HV97_9BACL|nr:hypothetical protein [Paenibacillus odorifer]OMD55284.1 hypothetical protein BSK51_04315 [Paenibacillus odorifer]
MDGWIKLHRKIRENPVFNDMNLFRLWMICLTEATHKERDQMIGKQIVKLFPGEFVTGRFDLAEMYNRGLKKKEQKPPTTIWRWLENLEKHEFVVIKSNNKFSVVAVVKWLEYQTDGQQNGQQVVNNWSTDGQQVVTNKNDKNDKKVKSNSPKQVYDEDSLPFRTANYLYTNILKHKPDLKQPNLQTWANDMRKLIDIDNREPAEIGRVIEWATKDSFWQSNILSASKLREKWDTLTAQMKNKTVSMFPTQYQSKADKDAQQREELKREIVGGMTLEDIGKARSIIDITPNQNSLPQFQPRQ